MNPLERKITHRCEKPEVEDRTSQHRWTCDGCGTGWIFRPHPPKTWPETVGYGFLGLRSRTEMRSTPDWGRWVIDGLDRRAVWVKVEETA